MLQAGKNITQANDPLVKIQPDYLYHAVRNPKPEIIACIRQLRLVHSIDENRYRQLKKQLPYVVCGIFNPPYRRTENLGWINHFIIDIDHIGDKELDLAAIKSKICTDSRVKMVFISPSEDGLKVLFQLSEKCYDAGRFSLFYKLFARTFSTQYQLEQVTDNRTSDATRACFISFDPEAYFNPEAETVNMAAFVDFDNPLATLEWRQMIKKEEKEDAENKPVQEKEIRGPDDDALAAIKARLNPSHRTLREKLIFVPEEMEAVVARVVTQMQSFDIETHEVINIHYGKKFKFRLQLKEAEINLFYGKRGFTVVQSPRHGTHAELNAVCAQILTEMLL
jgi:hypothetical protein